MSVNPPQSQQLARFGGAQRNRQEANFRNRWDTDETSADGCCSALERSLIFRARPVTYYSLMRFMVPVLRPLSADGSRLRALPPPNWATGSGRRELNPLPPQGRV